MDLDQEVDNIALSEHEILFNVAALNSLRRPQLVSLSKKYNLKASGKNQEIVRRLSQFGLSMHSLPPGTDESEAQLDSDLTSPAPSVLVPPQPLLNHKASTATIGATAAAEGWEVLTDANASFDERERSGNGLVKSDSMRSWKSAGNGESLGDFGGAPEPTSAVSSLKSLTNSIRRSSRTLLSNPLSSRPLSKIQANGARVESTTDLASAFDKEDLMDLDAAPSSPASTIGVVKRHSTMSLHPRPSTIRLVSPIPFDQPVVRDGGDAGSGDVDDEDDLPFVKKRMSMDPLGRPSGSVTSPHAFNRRSMPALSPRSGPNDMASPKVYPNLPTFSPLAVPPGHAVETSVPGSFPLAPPTPRAVSADAPQVAQTPSRAFVFGGQDRMTTAQFNTVASDLMRDMMAKSGIAFNPELLKGKRAEVGKLVNINDEIGTGNGWGLSASTSTLGLSDRYAEAHQKEFARMQSLSTLNGSKSTTDLAGKRKMEIPAPSAPNGAPLVDDGRAVKRTKMSSGPASSLMAAKRGLMNRLHTPRKRRTSNIKAESKGKSVGSALHLRSPAKVAKALLSPKHGSLTESLHRTQTAVRHASTDLSNAFLARVQIPKSKQSTSASVADVPVEADKGSLGLNSLTSSIKPQSSVSSKSRHPIPDFGPARSAANHASEGKTSVGPSGSTASSLARSTAFAKPTIPRSMSTMNASKPSARGDTSRKAFASGTSTSTKTVPTGGAPASSLTKSTASSLARSTISTSRSTSGLPRSNIPGTSAGLHRPSRAEVRAEIIGGARPAPAPPSTFVQPSLPRSRSTLYAPTASSLARMQATAPTASASTHRPAGPRPLPPTPGPGQAPRSPAPVIPTAQPFGEASSRGNLFESTFHLPMPESMTNLKLESTSSIPTLKTSRPPLPKPPHSAVGGSSGAVNRTPSKQASASALRLRNQASGLSAVKSKSDIRGDQKKAEIRARTERRAEEKTLRAMLGE